MIHKFKQAPVTQKCKYYQLTSSSDWLTKTDALKTVSTQISMVSLLQKLPNPSQFDLNINFVEALLGNVFRSFMTLASTQTVFNSSKSTRKKPEHYVESLQSQQQRHKNDVMTSFWCLFC